MVWRRISGVWITNILQTIRTVCNRVENVHFRKNRVKCSVRYIFNITYSLNIGWINTQLYIFKIWWLIKLLIDLTLFRYNEGNMLWSCFVIFWKNRRWNLVFCLCVATIKMGGIVIWSEICLTGIKIFISGLAKNCAVSTKSYESRNRLYLLRLIRYIDVIYKLHLKISIFCWNLRWL